MDGVHDLGGKPGHGEVDKSGAERTFHARWEAAVFTMVNSAAFAGAYKNTDQFRHAIERIDPRAYLTHGYYGRWLGGLENLLVERGVVTTEELTARSIELGAAHDDLIAAQPSRNPDPIGPDPLNYGSDRPLDRAPLFTRGDRVRTNSTGATGHTRLPSYARGKVGTIVSWHEGWVFPDTNAHGQGEQPQHLYTVEFTGEELWNRGGFSVSLDLFEPYLSRVEPEEKDV